MATFTPAQLAAVRRRHAAAGHELPEVFPRGRAIAEYRRHGMWPADLVADHGHAEEYDAAAIALSLA